MKNSGNQKLLDTPSRRLCVRRYLCVNHFEENQFFDKFRRRLRRNAIPTIFSSTPLSDELMSKFPVLEDPLNPGMIKLFISCVACFIFIILSILYPYLFYF